MLKSFLVKVKIEEKFSFTFKMTAFFSIALEKSLLD